MARSIRYLVYASFALLVSSPVLAQQSQGPMNGPHMWNGSWSGWFFGPMMMMIFFLVVLVAVIVLVIRWLGGSGQGFSAQQHAPPGKTPLDILKERFAMGEIDKEEFEERRRALGE